MPALFVDTSAFYAVADRSDRHHGACARIFQARALASELVTSDHVFVETWCLVRARLGKPAAMQFWDAMRGPVVRVLGVLAADLARARAIVDAWPDQDFSLVDATSFALMERLGVREALSVDRHFRVFRSGPARRRSLVVFP